MNKLLIALLIVPSIALADNHLSFPKGVTANVTKQQLCVSGYTHTVRPPVSYTDKLKKQWVNELPTLPVPHTVNDFELDHYIPIELGGSPTDSNNLWLQPWASARKKDVQETLLHRDMCLGIYTLQQAQDAIRKWKN